ncbi:MAG: hypothetical protein HY286_00295 [Planctomycetes bacterium]|nr:hypothetical protein [Planctomycetota bacterium]
MPAATDIWFFEHTRDPSGDFYRKVVTQREGMEEAIESKNTTQGFYILDPDGKLYSSWNKRGGELLKTKLKEVLQKYKAPSHGKAEEYNSRIDRRPPKGSTVVEVYAKITDADYGGNEPNIEQKAYRDSLGRDHLWITKAETATIAHGKMPKSVANRIARYHLNDFTRGEPPIWNLPEIVQCDMRLEPDPKGYKLTGEVELAAGNHERHYSAKLYGLIESDRDRITRFDVIAKGVFNGHGAHTKVYAPPGDFTLVIGFKLAPPGEASETPPEGVTDAGGYLKE